ncbi:hypothetical protein RF11_16268 [Thelohanellus kitauei]|uniref:Uncharacterized protein n=1 Tax=Thelohanellus kitauei TaxID=669202 RepID=A0A0C2JKP3_THEKT|nr:hypothetical protein RF11_16268 [Thelohanellus kitauei]
MAYCKLKLVRSRAVIVLIIDCRPDSQPSRHRSLARLLHFYVAGRRVGERRVRGVDAQRQIQRGPGPTTGSQEEISTVLTPERDISAAVYQRAAVASLATTVSEYADMGPSYEYTDHLMLCYMPASVTALHQATPELMASENCAIQMALREGACLICTSSFVAGQIKRWVVPGAAPYQIDHQGIRLPKKIRKAPPGVQPLPRRGSVVWMSDMQGHSDNFILPLGIAYRKHKNSGYKFVDTLLELIRHKILDWHVIDTLWNRCFYIITYRALRTAWFLINLLRKSNTPKFFSSMKKTMYFHSH